MTREFLTIEHIPSSEPASSLRSHVVLGRRCCRGEKMREVHELIGRVADTDVTVLVRGESGTGKELVARAIHDASPRQSRTFVKVNCAALPGRAAGVGALRFRARRLHGRAPAQARQIRVRQSRHDVPRRDQRDERALQAKLLQVLQDGEFARLGGRQDVRVDVRVVAATNRDLESAVTDGHFREDLFFRLNVVCITLPPLRQRRDDIPILTEQFLRQYAEHYNRPAPALATDTLRLFAEYDWPGNVRELENLIKRMVVVGTDAQIRREVAEAIAGRALRVGPIPALQPPLPAPVSTAPVFVPQPVPQPDPAVVAAAVAAVPMGSLKDIARHAAREAERELISRTLQQTRWNRREAAEILGISYKALLYKIKEAELDRAS